jgi:hypothetical protein
MLELLLGMGVGVIVGSYNHEKFDPCFQPFLEELVDFKRRLEVRISDRQRTNSPRR